MAAPAGEQAKISYIPQPHEQAYYDGLFAVADKQRTGSIGGQDAVRFLSLSGLPVDVLKPVWTLADQPPTNALDRQKFYVAVRLIQLLQNGQKGQGPNLAAPEGVALRPAGFKGVSGASVPMPPVAGGGGVQQQQIPPQPQQQYNQAPAAPPQGQQQQQQQQPPPNQQQPTPPRPPHPAQQQRAPPAAQSTALTAQDPYTLTPSEQSRYEGLFPEYAKPDGYVYGSEAVALFGKSGLPQPQLAALWNMVDTPIDNRLDKLEFAIIMHLIVCVSKKNLPMPPGLPVSLKQLKAQLQQSVPNSPAHSAAQPQPASSPVPSVSSMPPPAPQQQQPMQQQPTMSGPPSVQRVPTYDSAATGMSSLPGPPPLQPSGGADIHDAFAGLNSSDASQPMSQPPAMGFTSLGGSSRAMDNASLPSPSQPIEQTPAPAVSAAAIPQPQVVQQPAPSVPSPVEVKTTEQLKSSYDMGEASEELVKLKAVLQKLQAENISLKATMGSLTEEEKDVQKELSATVAEIGKLSNELTTLRAQVLAAKSRLLEATAELKMCHEKKAVVSDLIAEASATKAALDDAYNGIEHANEAARDQPAPAPAPLPAPSGSGSFDGDFFSFDAAPAPAPAPTLPEPTPGAPDANQEPPPQQHDVHSYGAELHQQPPLQQRDAPSFGAEPSHDAHTANAAEAQFGHNRVDSTGSGYMEGEGIMGGAPAPLPSDAGPVATPLHPSGGAASHDGSPPPTMESIAALKEKLKEADDVARDAEESRRQVAAQTDELRRLADEAESKSREHAAIPEGGKKKGKGFLGRGKKKDAKEGERLAQDAKSKKDKLLEAQSQLNDSQALAVETKAEAEKLRKEVEDAEIKLASAASMQHSQPPPPPQQHQQHEPLPVPQTTNGGYPPMGQDPWGSIPQQKAAPPMAVEGAGNGAFGGEPLSGHMGQGGFNSAVMASGGPGIPDIPPASADDPYSNPFSDS